MRGSSGAALHYHEVHKLVYKLDTPITAGRVAEQGHWIKRYTNQYPHWKTLPRVDFVFIGGYAMEPLFDNEMPRIPTSHKLQKIAELLSREIWRGSPVAALDQIEHTRYVTTLLGQVNRNDLILLPSTFADVISTKPLWRCLTHGDPIVDNVLHRRLDEETQLVIIDPIPATPAIPDILASDVGRLVQSAVGYENARYGFDAAIVPPHAIAQIAYVCAGVTLRDHEYSAVLYFAIVHMLRGVRTAQRVAPDRVDQLNELVNILVKELYAWTR